MALRIVERWPQRTVWIRLGRTQLCCGVGPRSGTGVRNCGDRAAIARRARRNRSSRLPQLPARPYSRRSAKARSSTWTCSSSARFPNRYLTSTPSSARCDRICDSPPFISDCRNLAFCHIWPASARCRQFSEQSWSRSRSRRARIRKVLAGMPSVRVSPLRPLIFSLLAPS